MLFERFEVGGDRNLAYLAIDNSTGEAIAVDPSYSPERILEFASEEHIAIRYVFNTHRHHDHSNGNEVMENALGLRVLAFGDTDPVSGIEVTDNSIFTFGRSTVQVIYTPGHTDDSICLYAGDGLFTGDTLFVGKVGGTDFEDGARQEYDSLHQKLLKLPAETKVFPGHDVGIQPESTIGNEIATNPFLLQPNFEAFVNLKKNWLEYKKKHGIA